MGMCLDREYNSGGLDTLQPEPSRTGVNRDQNQISDNRTGPHPSNVSPQPWSNEQSSPFPEMNPQGRKCNEVQIAHNQVGRQGEWNEGQPSRDIKQSKRLESISKIGKMGMKRKSTSQDLCDICYEKFHILKRWPMQICRNQHYICDECVRDFEHLYGKEPFPCPFCRLLIFQHEIKPYQTLMKQINKMERTKEQDNSEELQFYYFVFEYQLYEIACLFKQNRQQDLQKLQHLNFESKQLSTFDYFSRFKRVLYLQLQRNKIYNCQFLNPLASTLKIINLNHNNISELSWTESFANLQILAIEYNNIKKMHFTTTILSLKELFLIGNALHIFQGLEEAQFQNLQILSIESQNNHIEHFYIQKVQSSVDRAHFIPKLHTFIFSNSFVKSYCLNYRDSDIKIMGRSTVRNSNRNFTNGEFLSVHLHNYYQYGNLFCFQPHEQHPHSYEYSFCGKTLRKASSNFTNVNSSQIITPCGKQTLKLKLLQKNPNIMIGICTGEAKFSASVYSSEFIGITFWGVIYRKSQKVSIDCDLRLSEGSIIAMTVDFEKYEITWSIDGRRVGQITNEQSFLSENQLYFIVGVRDEDIKMQFLDEE